jgi:hypothetical protein
MNDDDGVQDCMNCGFMREDLGIRVLLIRALYWFELKGVGFCDPLVGGWEDWSLGDRYGRKPSKARGRRREVIGQRRIWVEW